MAGVSVEERLQPLDLEGEQVERGEAHVDEAERLPITSPLPRIGAGQTDDPGVPDLGRGLAAAFARRDVGDAQTIPRVAVILAG
jgi:hypothetical protein